MTAGNSEKPQASEFQKVAECLYRHGSSGTYYALVKRSGKQFRRSLRTKDRKMAERFLADFREKVGGLSATASASHVVFRDLSAQWLESLRGHLKLSSFRWRQNCIGHINRHLGSLTLRQVTARICEEWASKRGEGLGASAYNNERDTLRLVLDYAKREGLLLDNPAASLARRKLPRHSVRIPSKEQFGGLVRTLRGMGKRSEEAANLVELLAYSGMRLGEAVNLKWREVNAEAGRFSVTGGELGTKNHEAREVPLFPALRAFLARLRGETALAPDDLVIGIASAKTAMASAAKKANLPIFTHHCLRHYFCSNAIEAGVDFKVIAAWLGHKDGGLLVAKTYGHMRDTHSHEMAKRMTFSAS